MYKTLKVSNEYGTVDLEESLNAGWIIHDKTATHDWIIYILWMKPKQGSGN